MTVAEYVLLQADAVGVRKDVIDKAKSLKTLNTALKIEEAYEQAFEEIIKEKQIQL